MAGFNGSEEIKYVPIEINCVWVVDREDRSVSLIGQLPRAGLREQDVDLPEWTEAVRDYGDREEKVYDVRIGPLDEFVGDWIASKMSKSSFEVANLKVY